MMIISNKILTASMLAIAAIVPISLKAQSDFAHSEYDQLQAFGFATCDSRIDSNPSLEKITGGGVCTYEDAMALLDNPESGKKVKVLTAENVSKDDDIKNAIKNNDIVILDGSKGDFVIKKFITIQNQGSGTGCNDKTILGINNARLVTEWFVTPDVIEILKDAGVEGASTSKGTGGKLPNGIDVDEEAEYLTRKALYEKYGNENYRDAGVFSVKRCKNLIFRNICFVGPGSIDCSGNDLLSIQYSSNVWVDHCEFIDGIDGNFDISNESDMITVSWNEFFYTDRSLMHQNTTLIGSSDSKVSDDDKLSVTLAYNSWGAKCRARMPMARFGRFHMLNNYFNCKGNLTACINPRKNSEFLIEGNYFEVGVKKIFSQQDATSVIWADDNVTNESFSKPASFGECYIPYSYTKIATDIVKEDVKTYAGSTLWGSTKSSEISEDEVTGINSVADNRISSEATFNLFGQKVNSNKKGIVVRGGRKYIVR